MTSDVVNFEGPADGGSEGGSDGGSEEVRGWNRGGGSEDGRGSEQRGGVFSSNEVTQVDSARHISHNCVLFPINVTGTYMCFI